MVSFLMHHFSLKQGRHAGGLHRQHWFIKARQDREKREERAEKTQEDNLSAGIELVMATEQQLAAFEVKLDKYDTATVAALMENQKQLDAARTKIDLMLSQAYIMEDGRRVFKTEDGTQVFDETGQEISEDVLDFELIGPEQPSWESFSTALKEEQSLLVERQEIITFQEKLDESRERVSEGDISEAELQELDAELEGMMPNAVRAQMPDMDAPMPAPDLTAAFKTPATLPTVASTENNLSAPALIH